MSKPFSVALTLCFSLLFLSLGCSSTKNATSENNETSRGIEQESVLKNMEAASASSEDSAIAKQDEPLTISSEQELEALLDDMSLREKIGQLFFVSAYGTYKSNDDASYRELISQIRDHHIGGVIFFSGEIYGQAILTNKLQKASRIPLWITQDMEYGAAMRVRGSTRFVPAMGVAATQNTDYAYWVGKVTAREAKALGVNQIYAPVLDVNNNPDNPVINVRSFSGDARTVASFGEAFINGAESEGVISTAKHFPGHGDTDTDSHISLPTINYDYARLDSLELVPFRSAINNGLKSVMSAHIAFPKISNTPTMPGTMDGSILNGILQDSLDFGGVVVTDGLEMSGIASNYSPGSAVVKALQAGADLMLLSPDLLTAINEVEKSVDKGIITEERIERSVRKLLQWKQQHGLFEQKEVDINELSSKISTRENELIADEISRKSLTLVKNENDLLPIRPDKYPKIMVLSVADDESGNTGSGFAERLRAYHPDVTFHVLDKRTSEEEELKILKDALETDLLVIGSFIYVRSGQSVQISEKQMALLKSLPDKP
ncbi:MAG: glycoside hydrolase family 3 protein, partial [Balneolaceae bacterium]|nr:glycoside hydrolase family 3 protein [Balneolaceae bacterium]